jgi:dihydroorotate dehydrogenase electron transfer subunit
MMNKTVQNLTVLSNIQLNRDHHLLELKSPVRLDAIAPGQFVNVRVVNSQQTFLRRPFSIYGVDYEKNSISLFIKDVGPGSHLLTSASEGEEVDVVFPLGKGFSFPEKNERILLVGGGFGIAPLLFFAREMHLRNLQADVRALVGARTANDLMELDAFAQYGEVHTTTEDGTHGMKGRVTDHPVFRNNLQMYNRVYTCGPDAMMKAVAAGAAAADVFCEVSLENTMACGFGVCLCCVTDTVSGHQCVCTDGPVFNIKDLKW